jgi:hypothetical protein
MTGARCGFVIDLWAFPRATVQQGHSMNNGKGPNQSDIRGFLARLGQTRQIAKRKDAPGWWAFLTAMGAS